MEVFVLVLLHLRLPPHSALALVSQMRKQLRQSHRARAWRLLHFLIPLSRTRRCCRPDRRQLSVQLLPELPRLYSERSTGRCPWRSVACAARSSPRACLASFSKSGCRSRPGTGSSTVSATAALRAAWASTP